MNPTTTASVDEEIFASFLETLNPALRRIAYSLIEAMYCNNSIDLEDLLQEGRIAIWTILSRDTSSIQNIRSYCLACARRAMYAALKGTPAISLEDYLEVDAPDGAYSKEVADTSNAPRHAPLAQRRYILGALNKLSKRQRLTVMSYYSVDARHPGHSYTPESVKARFHMKDRHTYSVARRDGLKSLRRILTGVK